MASLAEREGLRGKVQMIYIDPPYGIKFGSQLAGLRPQARREGRQARGRHPRGRADQGVPRHLGARHPLATSTYLRDRLRRRPRPADRERQRSSSRSATRTSTSCGALMDEVFGSENFVSLITFSKTSGLRPADASAERQRLHPLVRQGQSTQLKYRQLYRAKALGGDGRGEYDAGRTGRRNATPLTAEERSDPTRFRRALASSRSTT